MLLTKKNTFTGAIHRCSICLLTLVKELLNQPVRPCKLRAHHAKGDKLAHSPQRCLQASSSPLCPQV